MLDLKMTILITSNGACKLGAFGFTPTGHSSGDSANVRAFHYAVSVNFHITVKNRI
ncbi:unnamed protein product [Coffea canephora]|uniref:Uncharacterized protein n=1 Tax=Coffea canephora TaxID=49390 RepID=A0A068UTH2_COFCA|nr:unnamed protein product [Coffea canephora]